MSLGGEDPLKKETAVQSSILAWEIPWTEEPVRLQCMKLQRVRHNLATKQQSAHRKNKPQDHNGAFLVAQLVKNSPAMNKTGVRSPGQEDPLGKKMAARSSILARELPGTEEPGRLQAMGSHESDMIYRLNHHNTKYHNKQFVGTIEVKRVLKSWRMVIFSKWSVWGLTK